ncbi:1,4-dihydroxy-2-naphthoate octaprenyltransferase [Virgibacillus natechei]|uniref:1,4-dihydroxy-2-naphthoate octaprenyltransferase n=1 Tax=Virgibacillus sp. CBA3643 TaxID=2942278 RepID=UPI0035A3D14A
MGIIQEDHVWKDNAGNYAYRFSWLQLMRPMTFSATISPVLAGTALAAFEGPIRFDILIVLLIAALFIQASANMLNDYYDFSNGQDQEKWMAADNITGSKPLHHKIPFVAWSIIGIAVILGAWISIQTTWWIAFIGTIGILVGFAYSAGQRSLASLGLGELVAALFLGFVTTGLGYIVQGHAINTPVLMIAFLFALLISTMILTNNIRDLKKDQGYRNTLAMRLGRRNGIRLLTALLTTAYLWMIILILFQIVSWMTIITMLAIPIAYRLRWSFRESTTREDEISAMKWAGRHHWAFGLLFVLGMALGL